MFHGRSRLNYDKESLLAVEQIQETVFRSYFHFNKVILLKLYFKFCVDCSGFDTPWNILKNFKTMFTNVYCTISNRLHNFYIPPKELEILAFGFRGFYFKIKYPTSEVVKFQVGVYFKLAGLQFLLQILRFHHGPNDTEIINLIDKVNILLLLSK